MRFRLELSIVFRESDDPNGAYCAIGSYSNNSVTLTDIHGEQLWQRTDVNEVQNVRFSLDGETLFCSHHRGIVSQFDVRSGETLRFNWFKKDLYGAEHLVESPYDKYLVIDRIEGDIRITDQRLKQVAIVKRKTFAVLDYAFAPDFMCISESGGTVTCYHLETGKEVWELPVGNGVHALELGYNEESEHFSAVTWPYKNGGPFMLLNIGRYNGKILSETRLPNATDFGFIDRGTRLILSTGQIMSASTGEQLEALDVSTDSAK